MNNKPYGYVMKFESGIEVFNRREYEVEGDKRIISIPLYTTPKELSDEEIWETIIEEMGEFYRGNTDVFELCNSIIKKAQEK